MVAPRDGQFPAFQNPPVVEVAISVQFEELSALRNVHLGLLWNRYRDQYPRTEEHPPLPDIFERFEPERREVGITIETVDVPPVPRLWLLNPDSRRLIQVQRSRFIHNWRGMEGPDPYPHYPNIRAQFVSAYEAFLAFLKDESIGFPAINQCEITYVNHIEAVGIHGHGDPGVVLTMFKLGFSDNFLSTPEDGAMALRFRMHDDDGNDCGRLHIQLQPAFTIAEKRPIFVLTLTARGKPKRDDFKAAMGFLDVGHEWIVRGFTSITTKEMHERWERVYE